MEIKYSRLDLVATLYLDPEVKFDETCRELKSFFVQTIERNLRVIIIRSGADRDFDLGIHESSNLSKLKPLLDQIMHCPIPVIAAAENTVTPSGLEICKAAHICLASVESTFGSGGNGQASFTAKEARSRQLVNRIIPASQLGNETQRLADTILELAPIAISSCLHAVNRGLEISLDEGLALETKLFSEIFATQDMREGTSSFLEKRKPTFRGK